MYGKHFASMYKGSMLGGGPTLFAVWGYVIGNAVNGHVELNPQFLAFVLGASCEEVELAISVLCSPDIKSRSPEKEGRRLIQEGRYQYEVVNHIKYRSIRNEDERREYNRTKQAESRKKKRVKVNVNDSQSMSTMSKKSANTDTDTDTEKNTPRKRDAAAAPRVMCLDALTAEGVDPQAAGDWLAVRRAKKAPLTATAWAAMKREASKAGVSVGEAVRIAAERGWQAFKAEWHAPGGGPDVAANAAAQQTAAYLDSQVMTPEQRDASQRAREMALGALRRVS